MKQQIIISSLVDLDREDEYVDIDAATSDKLENLCGETEVAYRTLNKCISTKKLNSKKCK